MSNNHNDKLTYLEYRRRRSRTKNICQVSTPTYQVQKNVSLPGLKEGSYKLQRAQSLTKQATIHRRKRYDTSQNRHPRQNTVHVKLLFRNCGMSPKVGCPAHLASFCSPCHDLRCSLPQQLTADVLQKRPVLVQRNARCHTMSHVSTALKNEFILKSALLLDRDSILLLELLHGLKILSL
jgi:hypothetical protein